MVVPRWLNRSRRAWLMALSLVVCVAGCATPDLVPAEDSARKRQPTMTTHPASDAPKAFGYKTAWFAVRSDDCSAVAEVIGIVNPKPTSWAAGLEAAGEDSVFVSPPVGDWVFVVGLTLGEGVGRDDESWRSRLVALSVKFGEAQFFCSHRVVELHVWSRAVGGKVERAYGFLGEAGETLFDDGERTEGEIASGLQFFDERSAAAEADDYWEREDLTYPDEDAVMEIARRWGRAPIDLSASSAEPSVGLTGSLRVEKRSWWRRRKPPRGN